MFFDLAWSEIALIGIVAVVIIGPKELPKAIKGVASGIQKARKTLRDFQSQADELVREANLTEVRDKIHEVRSTISDIRRFDLKGVVEKHIDGDGSIRDSLGGLDGKPASSTPAWTPPATAATTAGAPDFIPPGTLAPYIPPPPPPSAATTDGAPPFIPPATLTPTELLPKPEIKEPEPAEAPAMVPPEMVGATAATESEAEPASLAAGPDLSAETVAAEPVAAEPGAAEPAIAAAEPAPIEEPAPAEEKALAAAEADTPQGPLSIGGVRPAPSTTARPAAAPTVTHT